MHSNSSQTDQLKVQIDNNVPLPMTLHTGLGLGNQCTHQIRRRGRLGVRVELETKAGPNSVCWRRAQGDLTGVGP